MIKKFLLIASFIVLPFMSISYAMTLSFPHASMLAFCTTKASALSLFNDARISLPVNAYANCRQVMSFGNRIPIHVKPYLTPITKTLEDWEGDSFAVFKYAYPGKPIYWVIIYNPDDLLGLKVIK